MKYSENVQPNWHGHNYVLYVTVKGTIDPQIGYVVNLKTLSAIIQKHVIELVDHKTEYRSSLYVRSESIG